MTKADATARAYADFRESLARFNEEPSVGAFRRVQLAGRALDEARGADSGNGRRRRRRAEVAV